MRESVWVPRRTRVRQQTSVLPLAPINTQTPERKTVPVHTPYQKVQREYERGFINYREYHVICDEIFGS